MAKCTMLTARTPDELLKLVNDLKRYTAEGLFNGEFEVECKIIVEVG